VGDGREGNGLSNNHSRLREWYRFPDHGGAVSVACRRTSRVCRSFAREVQVTEVVFLLFRAEKEGCE